MLYTILYLLVNKDDRQLLGFLNKAFYDIDGILVTQNDVLSRAGVENKTLLLAWRSEVLYNNKLSNATNDLIENDLKDLLLTYNYKKFIGKFVNWIGLNKLLINYPDTYFNILIDEMEFFKTLLMNIDKKYCGNDILLEHFLHELDLYFNAEPLANDAIPCFTIYSLKGIKFDHLYVIGMVEDIWPSWSAIRQDKNSQKIDDERMNFFRAITCAEKSLTITYSKYIFGYEKKPSRFLVDM